MPIKSNAAQSTAAHCRTSTKQHCHRGTASTSKGINASLVILGLGLGTTLLSALALTSTTVKADNPSSSSNSVVDDVSITVPSSCTMSGSGTTTHADIVASGITQSDIGTTTINAYCNDNDGFSIYAIGYTGNTLGNNKLIDTTTNNEINTSTTTGGNNPSSWAMKLATTTSPTPTYPVIIAGSTSDSEKQSGDPDYTSYQAVPSTYSRVAYRTTSTDTGTSATGSTLTTTYQAFISNTQPAGTYNGKVKYILVHPNTIVAGTYTIAYNANGGSGTTAGTTAYNFEEPTLAASTFTAPSGYAFAGWCDTQDTDQNPQTTCPGEAYAAGDTLPASAATANATVTLYAYWAKLPTMQEFAAGQGSTTCAAMSIGDTLTLVDGRDSTQYRIGKLADNKCWMLDNLALDLTNNGILNALDATNTNIDETNDPGALAALKGTTVRDPNADSTGKYATAKVANWTSSYSYSAPLVNLTDKDVKPQGSSDPLKAETLAGEWKVGGYYNYCAASAGSYCYGNGTSYGTSSGNATSSICPKGWRMPTSNGGETNTLYNAYSSASEGQYTAFRKALLLPLSGYFDNGSASIQGSYGYWWSSTRYSSSNRMYYLYAGTSSINPSNGNGRYYGYSLRCILES